MLPMLPQDKANHVVYGAALALITLIADPTLPVWAPFVVSAVVGALKEVYDQLSSRGTPDVLDFVATAAGGFVVSAAVFVH